MKGGHHTIILSLVYKQYLKNNFFNFVKIVGISVSHSSDIVKCTWIERALGKGEG